MQTVSHLESKIRPTGTIILSRSISSSELGNGELQPIELNPPSPSNFPAKGREPTNPTTAQRCGKAGLV